MRKFLKLFGILTPIALVVIFLTADEGMPFFAKIIASVGIAAIISFFWLFTDGLDYSFFHPESTWIISCPDCGYIGAGYSTRCPKCKGNRAKRIR